MIRKGDREIIPVQLKNRISELNIWFGRKRFDANIRLTVLLQRIQASVRHNIPIIARDLVISLRKYINGANNEIKIESTANGSSVKWAVARDADVILDSNTINAQCYKNVDVLADKLDIESSNLDTFYNIYKSCKDLDIDIRSANVDSKISKNLSLGDSFAFSTELTNSVINKNMSFNYEASLSSNIDTELSKNISINNIMELSSAIKETELNIT